VSVFVSRRVATLLQAELVTAEAMAERLGHILVVVLVAMLATEPQESHLIPLEPLLRLAEVVVAVVVSLAVA
jgi:hypothetical protein